MADGALGDCGCGCCQMFVVDAGHLCVGFLPLPVWARGSYSVEPSGDTSAMVYAVDTFFGEDLGLCKGRFEYGDLDAAGTPSVPWYLVHTGVQDDLRITHRYLKIRYEASGYNVSGTGAYYDAGPPEVLDNPWVFEPWSRYSEATVERHSGLITSLSMGVTVGEGEAAVTKTYTKTLNTTTGAYAETGSFTDVCNAATSTYDAWTNIVASGYGGAEANIGEAGADLYYYITPDAFPGNGQPDVNMEWLSSVVMDPETIWTIEDALAEAESLLEQVDLTKVGKANYKPTINGIAQRTKFDTKLIVGWCGWPLAARIQSVDYPPILGAAWSSPQDDRRVYPARRTMNWSFPHIATEDEYWQEPLNTAFSDAGLPTYFFNGLDGFDNWDNIRLGVRVAKGCVSTESLRVCAHTENMEPPTPNTAYPPASDNGTYWSYDDDIEDCVRDFMPGERICVDPADIIFEWGRMRLLRRCFSSTTDPACCDMENP